MIKFFCLATSMLLILIACKEAQSSKSNSHSIKIVLDTEEPITAEDTIYIIGNQSKLNSWNNPGLAMKRRSETRWEQTFSSDSNQVEFKFTLGSSETQAVSNRGIIPENSRLLLADRDTEVYFVIEDWKHIWRPNALDSIPLSKLNR